MMHTIKFTFYVNTKICVKNKSSLFSIGEFTQTNVFVRGTNLIRPLQKKMQNSNCKYVLRPWRVNGKFSKCDIFKTVFKCNVLGILNVTGKYCRDPRDIGDAQTRGPCISVQRCVSVVHRQGWRDFLGVRPGKVGRRPGNRSDIGSAQGQRVSGTHIPQTDCRRTTFFRLYDTIRNWDFNDVVFGVAFPTQPMIVMFPNLL